jgi:thiol-disulfide isomerase/thioredoxin
MKLKIILSLILVASLMVGYTNTELANHQKAETAVNSELVDSNNMPINLTQFRGKIVLINNWASWCPPCVAEMPSIQKLKNTLKGEDIVFIMVSYDDQPEKAMRFIQKKNFDFEVYFPGKKYAFHTESIPATFVLDKNGNVLAAHQGMANFDKPEVIEKFKSLLK